MRLVLWSELLVSIKDRIKDSIMDGESWLVNMDRVKVRIWDRIKDRVKDSVLWTEKIIVSIYGQY